MEKAVVVILNYNGKHLLEKFLPSVIAYSLPYRVIIVDNASEDDSVSFLTANYPSIPCIQHTKNEGFAAGYNLALQQIKSAYYILLNADVQVTKNWITPMLALMETNKSIVACQPKILSYYEPNKFEYAGAGGGFIDQLGYPFCRGRVFTTIEEDQGQYDDTREIFWASGACMFLRASSFWELGGFDPQLFAYYEEIDLCWRMQQHGYQVFYCGKSKVYHLGSATMGTDNPYKTYLKFRNRALVCYKNGGIRLFSWKHTLLIVLDLAAALQLLLQGKLQHSWAILKAQIDFFKLKNKYKLALSHPNMQINNRTMSSGVYRIRAHPEKANHYPANGERLHPKRMNNPATSRGVSNLWKELKFIAASSRIFRTVNRSEKVNDYGTANDYLTSSRKLPPKRLKHVYQRILPFDYFLRGKKKFSELDSSKMQ